MKRYEWGHFGVGLEAVWDQVGVGSEAVWDQVGAETININIHPAETINMNMNFAHVDAQGGSNIVFSFTSSASGEG